MENLISLSPSRKANDPADPAGRKNSAEIAASAAQAAETGPAVANAVIVGSGPAGYTAAIYLGRAGYSPIVLAGALSPGGQLVNTTEIENFPGFPDGIAGPELMDNMRKQAERFGAQVINDDVISADLRGGIKSLQTDNNGIFRSRTAIITTGSDYRKLEVPGEKEYSGKGVSYCATCDGYFFRGKPIAVIGGGDTAMSDALFLSRFGSSVTVIHRRDTFRASRILVDRAEQDPNITFVLDSTVSKINGDGTSAQSVNVHDLKNGTDTVLPANGIFIAIGHTPRTGFLSGQLDLDDGGYIRTSGATAQTSLSGVFAAGDVVDSVYRQAISAAGMGSRAALDAQEYLENIEMPGGLPSAV